MTMMSGVVEQVTTKDVSTKFGVKPTWAIRVNGQMVKCGFKNPNVEVGYQVDFDATASSYGLETKSVNIISKGSHGAAPAATSAVPTPARTYSSSGYKEKVFPIPPLHGDRSIVRQNALARATELFVAAKGGKPFELDDTTTMLVVNFARKFEAYTAGDLDLYEAENEAKTAGTESS